jgi:hypothetical protein
MPRRFQFRLRTLMIVVTLLAVPCAYVGWQAKVVRERLAIRENPKVWEPYKLESDWSPEISWIRHLLGDRGCIFLITDDNATGSELERFRAAFPEAKIYRNCEQPKPSGPGSVLEFHFRDRQVTGRTIQ